MVDDVTKFQSVRINLISSQRFFYCRLRNLLAGLFSLSHDVLAFSGSLPHSYIRQRGFYTFRVVERAEQ